MKNKTCLWLILLFLTIITTMSVFAQNNSAKNLDVILSNAGTYLNNRIPPNSIVVVLNISSQHEQLSKYIIEELTSFIVNNGTLTVVDRQRLELIKQEIEFQYSGEVSDDTMQGIGKKYGAQTVVTGSIEQHGNNYRLHISAISVETAKIQGQQSYDIIIDERIAALTGNDVTKDFINTNESWNSSSQKSIISKYKVYELTFQSDGNLVLYKYGKALWSSRTAGHPNSILTLQSDGNLVIYQNNRVIWSANCFGNSAKLVIQDDGNVVIYASDKAIWATGTNGK